MKTSMSRFQIHDELTAPDRSAPVLRGALAGGGQLPNFLGVLAGSPAALRAYARFRGELRHGTLPLPTLERIALAVSEHYGSEQGILTHSRAARGAGLGLDEVALARSSAPRIRDRLRCSATCRRCSPTVARRCTSTRRLAKPVGTTSSCSRRSRPLHSRASRR